MKYLYLSKLTFFINLFNFKHDLHYKIITKYLLKFINIMLILLFNLWSTNHYTKTELLTINFRILICLLCYVLKDCGILLQ